MNSSHYRPFAKELLSTEREAKGHRLAVVIPFRNRFEELLQFAPFIHTFLDRQHVRHQIWVVNQADNHRLGQLVYMYNVLHTEDRTSHL